MHFVGKISDESYVQHSGTYKSGEPTKAQVKNSVAREHGGEPDDYDVYFIEDKSTLARKINRGASFELVWENGLITGLDTKIEDGKKYLSFSSDKAAVTNNSESTTVSVVVYQSDGTSVDTSFRGKVRALCSGPVDVFEVEITVDSGTGSVVFSPDIAGGYSFPSGRVHCGSLDNPKKYKTKNQIFIESIVR